MARRCRSTSRTIPGSENQALETKGLSIFACCGTPHTPVFCCKSAQTIDSTELTISLFAKERRKSAQVIDYLKLSPGGSANERRWLPCRADRIVYEPIISRRSSPKLGRLAGLARILSLASCARAFSALLACEWFCGPCGG